MRERQSYTQLTNWSGMAVCTVPCAPDERTMLSALIMFCDAHTGGL